MSAHKHLGTPDARRLLASFSAGLITMIPWNCFADGVEDQVDWLQQNGIAAETAKVIAYLQRLQPAPGRRSELEALIAQLSDPDFAKREAAMRELSTSGELGRDLIAEATRSNDLDLRLRSSRILGEIDSEDQAQLERSLTLAALQVLQARGEPGAIPVLLATLELFDDPYLCDIAAEALWASASPEQIHLIGSALDHPDLRVRAAAIVALELAGGDGVAGRITALLDSREPEIRLAAARALIDREPQRAVQALVEITGEDADKLAWQADALLEMKTGHRIEADGEHSLGEAWRGWSLKHFADAELDQIVGPKRLDHSAGRNVLVESFARDTESLAQGYGRFRYQADNGGGAKVAGSKLSIDGNNPEGDQRLFITSEEMLGRERWPRRMEVRAKMTGETGNNFGWHMGVSVGRVKVLFHPGLPGGGFRAETTDAHGYLFPNEDMSFEPVCDVMHEMLIQVKETNAGAEFDVTITGGNGGVPHRKRFSATREQLGDYDRIGLERSGRTGGDAIFDSISIRVQPSQ